VSILVKTIVEKGAAGGPLRVATNEVGSPTHAWATTGLPLLRRRPEAPVGLPQACPGTDGVPRPVNCDTEGRFMVGKGRSSSGNPRRATGQGDESSNVSRGFPKIA